MSDFNFQKELEEAIRSRSNDTPQAEVLEDIFKTYVAKMMEQNVLSNKNRMEMKFILSMKAYLITEFRKANLDCQMSEGRYSELFDRSIQEIFNDAATAHEGEDKAELDENQTLDITGAAHANARGEISPGGIILPN